MATPNDRTFNKVALCSAIFAGFAYVGYSVVRTAFGRRVGRRDGEVYPEEHRLYFRRLSQTTQTDVLLGNLDLDSTTGKVILRPLTVQERIRELNLQARMFTDTMLAIQSHSGSPRHACMPGHRSLQCSPWSSPRILSPVDMRHILTSRSTENLAVINVGKSDVILGSPLRKRTNRRSFRKRGKSHSPDYDTSNAENERNHQQLEIIASQQREIARHDAKSLVILLQSHDMGILERTLTTISNGATNPINQVTLREAGCLFRIQRLLLHPKLNVQIAAITAIGNLALNQENQREIKDSIPVLMSILIKASDQQMEKLAVATLITLSNIALLPDWHEEFCTSLHTLYSVADNPNNQIKLYICKLLVNLSCNDDMIPSLLAAQAPKKLLHLLDSTMNEEILLSILILLANLTHGVKSLNIDPTLDLPLEGKAPSPDTMYAAIYGVNVKEKMFTKAFYLMNHHHNQDIKAHAQKIVEDLKPL